MRTIGIIGMGHVGTTIAHHLIISGLADKLVLIDDNGDRVNADALDFRESMTDLAYHTNISVNDYTELKNADIVISTVGKVKLLLESNGNRFAELNNSIKQVKSISDRLRETGFNGIIITITNPVDVITGLYQKITALPKNKVIGIGTILDSNRIKQVIGHILNINPRSVEGYNLGEHGNSQFTAWSTIRALGQPFTKIAKKRNIDLDAIDKRARISGQNILKGKHYINYSVSSATVSLVNAIMSDAHIEMPVSNYREEYGTYLSYPVIIGRQGVIGQVHLSLTAEEKIKLANSAEYIKNATKEHTNK